MAGLCEGGNEPPGSLKASKPVTSILELQVFCITGVCNVTVVFWNRPVSIELTGRARELFAAHKQYAIANSPNACNERIPNLSSEQSNGITVFRISPMESLSTEISQNFASVAQITTYTVAMTAIDPSSSFVPISLQRDVFVVYRSGEIRNTLNANITLFCSRLCAPRNSSANFDDGKNSVILE
ncbi:hypothetical protein ANN_18512 [Periplaneta americana]|uniref:Uncharacterized protein n=1 Tax=Periplaneta americana TaxID=6978 RepID=A0ABQ8SQF6_PERAM|nr:hypothetical protein ANN_18512 [Periplaneta americana]